MMQFDECPAWPCSRSRPERRTDHPLAGPLHAAKTREDQALFGIVQGAFYVDLRVECIREMAKRDLPGYGIGGLSVGEPKDVMYDVLEALCPEMPVHKPRYIMGVGSPDCLVEGTRLGIDMFDCVLATRVGRNGTVFTRDGRLVVRGASCKEDFALWRRAATATHAGISPAPTSAIC